MGRKGILVAFAGIVLLGCGMSAAAEGKADSAKAASAAAAGMERKSALRKGDLLVRKGDFEGALEVWKGLEAAYPGDAEILMRIGVTQSMLERYEESEAAFAKALVAAPEDATITYNYALMKLRNGDEKGAELELKRTLELFPNYPEANYHLGLIAERQGDMERAKSLYVKEMNENPNSARAWQRYFILRGQEGPQKNPSDDWALRLAAICAGLSVVLLLFVKRPLVLRGRLPRGVAKVREDEQG